MILEFVDHKFHQKWVGRMKTGPAPLVEKLAQETVGGLLSQKKKKRVLAEPGFFEPEHGDTRKLSELGSGRSDEKDFYVWGGTALSGRELSLERMHGFRSHRFVQEHDSPEVGAGQDLVSDQLDDFPQEGEVKGESGVELGCSLGEVFRFGFE